MVLRKCDLRKTFPFVFKTALSRFLSHMFSTVVKLPHCRSYYPRSIHNPKFVISSALVDSLWKRKSWYKSKNGKSAHGASGIYRYRYHCCICTLALNCVWSSALHGELFFIDMLQLDSELEQIAVDRFGSMRNQRNQWLLKHTFLLSAFSKKSLENVRYGNTRYLRESSTKQPLCVHRSSESLQNECLGTYKSICKDCEVAATATNVLKTQPEMVSRRGWSKS